MIASGLAALALAAVARVVPLPGDMTVTLSPEWGTAGGHVVATAGKACPDGAFTVGWEGETLPLEEPRTRTTARFQVPEAAPGWHTVEISCGKLSGSSRFTLIAAGIDPSTAAAGTPVTLTGAGFLCSADVPASVTVAWPSTHTAATETTAASGGDLRVPLTVPKVSPGRHTLLLTARCPAIEGPPVQVAELRLPMDVTTVTATPTAERPVLLPVPAGGPAGTGVRVTGRHFPCRSAVLRWEDGIGVEVPVVGGAFEGTLAVPRQALFGRRAIVAGCGEVSRTASFDVLRRTPRLTPATPARVLPGEPVSVTGTAFDCGIRAGQEDTALLSLGSRTVPVRVGASGGFHATLRVPPDTPPGRAAIVGTCPELPGVAGRSSVTVLPRGKPTPTTDEPTHGTSPTPPSPTPPSPTPPSPTPPSQTPPSPTPAGEVTETPAPEPMIRPLWRKGAPGALLPVAGEGFGCPVVRVGWDGEDPVSVRTEDGTFAVDLRVPGGSGERAVVASCSGAAEVTASAAFDVVPAAARATLELDPHGGPDGTTVTATGRNFPPGCAGPVLRLDGVPVPLRPDTSRVAAGEFEVPRGLPPKEYLVELTCQATAAAAFTVPRFSPRSLVSRAVPAPDELTLTARVLVGSAVFAGLIMLLLGFPAELFNKTFENSKGIGTRWRRLRDLRAALGRLPMWLQFGVASLAATGLALFAGQVDPWNWRTAVAQLVAVVVVTLTFTMVGEAILHWTSRDRGRFRLLPGGLVVAACFALVSRMLGLTPGYVYGLITTYVYVDDRGEEAERGTEEDGGRAVLVAAVATLGLSLMCWLVWTPVDAAADRGNLADLVLLGDATLASIFVTGVQTVLFGLIPLPFLDGHKLTRWSWTLWGVVMAVAAFAFVYIVSGAQAEDAALLDWPEVWRMLAVFVIAAALSLAFLGVVYLLRRRAASPAVASPGRPRGPATRPPPEPGAGRS
ncbi:FGLLP motif-containing membrane protein [Sphaerisporangium aureirubrum]|uniref:FGLLP motif-containing membrane protein n=1 Tax=Sphaerisporangium aureirubrum TaxID=1544736 RepID=A0ABW1NRH8_9ACTN